MVKGSVALVVKVSYSLKDQIELSGDLHCVELAHGRSRRAGQPLVNPHTAGLLALGQEQGRETCREGHLQ